MRHALMLGMLVILGAAIGSVITLEVIDYAARCDIVYVAQDEIMKLEEARIKNEKLEDKELFYGKPEDAVQLATEIPKNYKNRRTKLVYSMSGLSGENVRSISKEVHQKIIEKLRINKAGNNE